MIEIRNKLYIQRFFASSLSDNDLWHPVVYTDYSGDWSAVPFWYRKVHAHSAHIDLRQDIDKIFFEFKTSVRNEIRRAQKEGCIVEFDKNYGSFVTFYNNFCEEKGISDLKTNDATLSKYDYILISRVKYNGDMLCAHATLIDENSKLAMLMYSCSNRLRDGANKNLTGWANRFLHYKEFEHFKGLGLEIYEWNGVNIDPNTPEKYSIGKFKLGFGGEEEDILMLQTPLFVFMKFVQKVLTALRIL